MSCAPTPTATGYAVVTTFIPSTSYSQSAANAQQMTTIVLQSCVASGTINGSSVGCISSAQVTEVNTVGVGGGQTAQVPIVITVPVATSQPTETLFAPCTSQGGISSTTQSSTQSPTATHTPLTTTILVQSTPPPSTVIEASSTTLADGSVVETVVTLVTTLPPTSVYLATSLSSPTLQNNDNASQGSGTNVAPMVGGVLGGFLGLIAVVGSLWWLCRRRRSLDDIFEKEDLQNDDAWIPPARRDRDSRLSVEPKPYQYGLVGHVIPPVAAGESLRSSHYSSVSGHSATHSRHTSFSATPLLQATRSSRPSTAGSILTVQTHGGPRVLSRVGSVELEPRSLSMVSYSTRPLVDDQHTPALLNTWTPNTDDLAVLEPLARNGSPVSSFERRVLQIANDGPPSPTETVLPRRTSSRRSSNVIMHTDGGPVLGDEPPAYAYAL